MLRDRRYMNQNPDEDPMETARGGLKTLYTLIIINILLFLIVDKTELSDLLPFTPTDFMKGAIWQPITAAFVHFDFWHLVFNMYALYFFGGLVAPRIGQKHFLLIYFICALAGNLLWFFFHINQDYRLVGASGAIMGVIMVAAMLFPNIPMYLLFIPFPMKLKTLALTFFVLDVLQQIGMNAGGNIAYLAHIGGFIAGGIYASTVLKKMINWNPWKKIFGENHGAGANFTQFRNDFSGYKRYSSSPEKQEQKNFTVHSARFDMNKPVTQSELDALLDKLSKEGINALTEVELQRLRQAREQMRKQS